MTERESIIACIAVLRRLTESEWALARHDALLMDAAAREFGNELDEESPDV